MKSHEDSLFRVGNVSDEAVEMHRFLGITFDFTSVSAACILHSAASIPASWNAPQALRVCALLSAYRLADVVCMVENVDGIGLGLPVERSTPATLPAELPVHQIWVQFYMYEY